MLNVVAAPAGERLGKPEYRAAILKAVARLQSPEFKPTEDKAGLTSVGNLFNPNNVSDDARIAYAEAQFDRVIYEGIATRCWRCRTPCVRRSSRWA